MFYLSVMCLLCVMMFFFFKQKTAYEMRISDWSSDVCSSDLASPRRPCAELGQDPVSGPRGLRSRPGSGRARRNGGVEPNAGALPSGCRRPSAQDERGIFVTSC